jgi:pyridoxine 5-phosphate synthase
VRALTVGLDPLASLLERTAEPSAARALAAAAALADLAGAAAVRVGVNEEQRPLREADLRDLRRAARALELRMAPVPGLVKLALETRPERVLLASQAREAASRTGPLDWRAWGTALSPAVRTLREAGLAVSVVVGADFDAVKAAHAAEASGVELATGATVDLPERERAAELERLADVGRLAAKLRMRVTLSGGIGYESAGWLLAALPLAEGVAVGRAWVARSVLVGIDRATRDLRETLG